MDYQHFREAFFNQISFTSNQVQAWYRGFDKNTGLIITMNQQDEIRYKGKKISVVPAFKYLTERV